MKTNEFNSVFAPFIVDFIEYKRAAGYKYVTEVAYLKKFDDLCCTMDVQTPLLTKDLMDAWCTKKPYEADRGYFQQRVSCIRQLSLYLNTLGYDVYIPVNLEYIRQRKSKYSAYIFTHEEIAKIFSASNQIYPNRHSTMHLVMPVLIRLLYCTGVRIMEALKLQLKHVDLVNGTLMIEAAKFNKDRLIPVSQHAGRGYGPRIHDIRHTHCCHVLQKASGTGMDLTNMLPALSIYMGHESITATSQYLKMTAEVYPEILDAVEALCAQVIPEVDL